MCVAKVTTKLQQKQQQQQQRQQQKLSITMAQCWGKKEQAKKSETHQIGLRNKFGKRAKWNEKSEKIRRKKNRCCMKDLHFNVAWRKSCNQIKNNRLVWKSFGFIFIRLRPRILHEHTKFAIILCILFVVYSYPRKLSCCSNFHPRSILPSLSKWFVYQLDAGL